MRVDQLLPRLSKVKELRPHHWQACCPAHEDQTPSLSIGIGDDGRILLKCWTGCRAEDITGALGLGLADLFPESHFTPERWREYARQSTAAEVEAAVLFELRVLVEFIQNRVTDRQLAKDRQFREARPEWRPMPAEHWQREEVAARRLKAGLARLYP
jgi:hypothetical protein